MGEHDRWYSLTLCSLGCVAVMWKCSTFKPVIQNISSVIRYKMAFRWMSSGLKSKLVHIMAWCHQAKFSNATWRHWVTMKLKEFMGFHAIVIYIPYLKWLVSPALAPLYVHSDCIQRSDRYITIHNRLHYERIPGSYFTYIPSVLSDHPIPTVI